VTSQGSQNSESGQDSQNSQTSGWQRAQNAFKNAQVTAAVAGHVLSPVAGPAAQQAHLEPVSDGQHYVQQIREEELHNAAHWELHQREQEAGQLVRETAQDRQEQQDKQDLERRKSQTRHRDRGR